MTNGKTVWLSEEAPERIEEASEDWMSPNQFLLDRLGKEDQYVRLKDLTRVVREELEKVME